MIWGGRIKMASTKYDFWFLQKAQIHSRKYNHLLCQVNIPNNCNLGLYKHSLAEQVHFFFYCMCFYFCIFLISFHSVFSNPVGTLWCWFGKWSFWKWISKNKVIIGKWTGSVCEIWLELKQLSATSWFCAFFWKGRYLRGVSSMAICRDVLLFFLLGKSWLYLNETLRAFIVYWWVSWFNDPNCWLDVLSRYIFQFLTA